MSRTTKDDTSRRFFGVQFTKQFQKGKNEGRWASQEDFGKKLKPMVKRGSVAKWSTGQDIPSPKNLRQICEIFGVEEGYFNIENATREELYQYSSDHMAKLVDENAIPYCDQIGLSVDFLYSIRSIMGGMFDYAFPIWTPIVKNPKLLSNEEYIRSTDILATSARTDPQQSIFQCKVYDKDKDKSDGRLVTMCRADLDFLRDVQEDVLDYIEFLFLKRLKGQEKEVEKANLLCRVKTSDGGFTIRRLTASQLNMIDKYGHYTDKASQVRNATQEDMDRFANGEGDLSDKNGVSVTPARKATQKDWDNLFGRSGGEDNGKY